MITEKTYFLTKQKVYTGDHLGIRLGGAVKMKVLLNIQFSPAVGFLSILSHCPCSPSPSILFVSAIKMTKCQKLKPEINQ